MAVRVHSERENLDWKVRRVWVPNAVRPLGLRQMQSGYARPIHDIGWQSTTYASFHPFVSPLFALLFAIPTMLVLLPLRLARLASWRVEAVAYPWGRRGPRTVMGWRVKGWSESGRAVHDVAAALERGEQNPLIENATRDG